MLDLYVSERVKELTKGQQTPTTVKPPNVPDFPVALLRRELPDLKYLVMKDGSCEKLARKSLFFGA